MNGLSPSVSEDPNLKRMALALTCTRVMARPPWTRYIGPLMLAMKMHLHSRITIVLILPYYVYELKFVLFYRCHYQEGQIVKVQLFGSMLLTRLHCMCGNLFLF